jgi:hypothetical protein
VGWEFHPKQLRKLAAQYRARAEAEPAMAETFLDVASDMESEAGRIEYRQP